MDLVDVSGVVQVLSGLTMKKNLLIVSKSFIYSTNNVNMTKYLKMNEYFTGDILGTTDKEKFRHYEEDGFHFLSSYSSDRVAKFKAFVTIKFILFALFMSVYRHLKVKKYDIIIAREPILAGPLAVVIKWLCGGTRLITELNGNYVSPVVWEDIANPLVRKIKMGFSRRIIPFVLKQSDGIKLLYPSQITPYLTDAEQEKTRVRCFHEYTPISEFGKSTKESNFIMTMGYPFNIKGFDILVSAFDSIADDYPETELHVIGYLTEKDRAYLESLYTHKKQIKLLKPLEYDVAMEKISECLFFVLASRTEAMGRVLLESMAHAKPVLGSTADGIPTYVIDGENGLLFESGNVSLLAKKMRVLLDDGELRSRLGGSGYERVKSRFSEQKYLDLYRELIDSL